MSSFWQSIGNGIVAASDFVCGYPLFILLIGGGLFFLVYSRFAPLRYFGRAVQALRVREDNVEGQISSFEALASAIAATVGLGNIAGVAIALSMGGPGAIFWMWVSAIVGMATKFFEGTLAVMFRGKDSEGQMQGGPMYMMTAGLGPKWKPMAVFFSFFGLFGTLCVMQSNQLTESILTLFVAPEHNTASGRCLIGLGIVLIVASVIFGGIKRISQVSKRLVPAMVCTYMLLILYIIISHISLIPGIFRDIFVGAFTLKAGLGGAAGSIVTVALTGVRRAALVNEAGVGTASMMHGASRNSEPVREGLVAMLGPSIDSGLVCTLTAIAILVGRAIDPSILPSGGDIKGLAVALNAFDAAIPVVGRYLLFVIVICFAFSTMFSYSYYGQKCLGFLLGADKGRYYNWFFLAMLVVTAVIPLRVAVSFIDLAFAMMAFPTMITLFSLAPKARREMDIYFPKDNKKDK